MAAVFPGMAARPLYTVIIYGAGKSVCQPVYISFQEDSPFKTALHRKALGYALGGR